MRNPFVIMTIVCALFTGCTDTDYPVSSDSIDYSRSSNVSYVCVGMETSKRFGSCPGCQLDSNRMNKLLSETFGYSGTLLQSEQATRYNVVKAMKDGIAATPKGGLFILYYSGHGGQEMLSGWDTDEPEGADAEDEYLCLYDTYLLDNEIWTLISACKGRVFLCFDACHSQTMFRSVSTDIALEKGLAVPLGTDMVKSHGFRLKPRAMPMEVGGMNMLCWSGCMEAEYSYGSSSGGVLTTGILKSWESGMPYDVLWAKAINYVNDQQPGQHPYATKYGSGFIEAFR